MFHYFSKGEQHLWGVSVCTILIFFFIFDRKNYLTLAASIIGVTSLVFTAKGNPVGQFLMVIFSTLYGFISFTFAYYGEMITYLGMTAPMAVLAMVSWMKNTYNGNRSQVKVNRLKGWEILLMLLLAGAVTTFFYYILAAFHTANLALSTLSVTTSSIAVFLTCRRSPFYALGYAANDVILIILWVLASLTNISYLSVVVCFAAFFVNDLYGFINWTKMQRQQELNHNCDKKTEGKLCLEKCEGKASS